jgi:putative FmdB family regulatory protein
MPVYTYHCDNCEHEFEKYQSFSEESLTTCPNCAQDALRKVYTPALVVFKGSGFYVTDTKSASSTLTSNNHNENHSEEEKPAEKPKKSEPKAEKGASSNGTGKIIDKN